MIRRIIAFCLIAGIGFSGVLFNEYSTPVYETLPTNGLVLHYKMDEAVWTGLAGDVIDSSGGGNHGRSYNGAYTNPSKFNRGGYFDGNNDIIRRASSDSISLSNAISVSLWVRVNDAPNWSVFATKSAVMSWYVRRMNIAKIEAVLKMTDLTIYFARSTSLITVSNGWVHVVFTYDSVNDDTVRLYINGSPDGVSTATGNKKLNATSAELIIGALDSGYSTPLNGVLDDFRMYNRLLTTNDVRQLYLAESYSKRVPPVIIKSSQPIRAVYQGGKLVHNPEKKSFKKVVYNDYTENMLSWWKMESTNGNVVADSVGSKTMTLIGSPPLVAGKVGSYAIYTSANKYGRWTAYGVSSNFSICMWVKTPTPTAPMSLLGLSTDGTVYNFTFNNSTQLLLKFNTGDVFFNIPQLQYNTWTHYTFSVSNANITVYCNGTASSSGVKSMPFSSLSKYDQIARYAGSASNPWLGEIDDVRIYSIPLSSDQAGMVYNSTK